MHPRSSWRHSTCGASLCTDLATIGHRTCQCHPPPRSFAPGWFANRLAGSGSLFLRFHVITRTHACWPTPPERSGHGGGSRADPPSTNSSSSPAVSSPAASSFSRPIPPASSTRRRRRRRRRRTRRPNATSKRRRHVAPALSASRRHRRSITSPSTPSGSRSSGSVRPPTPGRDDPTPATARARVPAFAAAAAAAAAAAHAASSPATRSASRASHRAPRRRSISSSTTLVAPTKPGYPSRLNPAKAPRVDAPSHGACDAADDAAASHSAARHPRNVPTSTPPTPGPGSPSAASARRLVSSLASFAARRISDGCVSSPRVRVAGGTAGGFALESSFGCARWGLDARGAGWTSASGVLFAGLDPSAYGSVGSARFCLMLSYIHSCRRIVGGVPPPAPATHDAGMDARYAANLGSSSSAHGGSTRSTCVARRLRSLAGTTTTHPRSRRNPAHALSRNLWTARGAWSATTHDRSSSLDMGRPGERARPWRRPRRGVVTRSMALEHYS